MALDAASPPPSLRETQRRQTRARLFDAAVAEIGRSGLAGADVAAIAASAGVARGTFYFHFPTKEHVLAELERDEETRIVDILEAAAAAESSDLRSTLTRLVAEVLAAEQRLGPVIFRDMLALHFASTRPLDDELNQHPLAGFVIDAIGRAKVVGQVRADVDPDELGVIFMTGLFALLATGAAASGSTLLDRFVTTIAGGMET